MINRRPLFLAALVAGALITGTTVVSAQTAKTPVETPRIAELTRQLAEAPNNVHLYQERGHAYALSGQREAALADLQRAYALDPNNARLLRHLGWTLFNLREFKAAHQFWLKSGELCNYDSPFAEYTTALGYWGVQDMTHAAQFYDRAVAKDKSFGNWKSLQERVSYWTSVEKQAIYEVFDAWRRGYKADGE